MSEIFQLMVTAECILQNFQRRYILALLSEHSTDTGDSVLSNKLYFNLYYIVCKTVSDTHQILQ